MPDEPDPSQPGWAAPTPPTEPSPTAPPPPGAPPPERVQPPPPGWGAPPPPGVGSTRPRRRRRWPWVLGAVLGAIVILAISSTVLFIQKVKPPIDAANAFLDDIEDGDVDERSRLCVRDRETDDEDLAGLLLLVGVADLEVNVFGVDIDGDRATVDVSSSDFDDNTVFKLPLRKEAGDWRVCLSDIELR